MKSNYFTGKILGNGVTKGFLRQKLSRRDALLPRKVESDVEKVISPNLTFVVISYYQCYSEKKTECLINWLPLTLNLLTLGYETLYRIVFKSGSLNILHSKSFPSPPPDA